MTGTVGGGPAAPPLSVAQEALFYSCLLAPRRISYNETVSIRKDGPFDVAAFRQAFDEVVRRHAAWRTTFEVIAGTPVQIVHPAAPVALAVHDLGGLTVEEAERQAVRLAADMARVPYDLSRGPLLRPRLLRFAPDHHRLYLALHHIIFDGVSVYRVILPELVALYDAFSAGRPSPLPEPATSYADYARWEQQWITGPRAARRLAHWAERLAGLPALTLPFDHPRAAAPRFRGGVLALTVPRELTAELRTIGQGLGATLFQVLATTWALLLARYSGQDDVVFATAADLRQRPEFEGVVGYCLTPVVLRVDLSDDPVFTELVMRVRNEVLDGLDHLVPFERLVRALDAVSPAGANPVYQTMLVLEPPAASPDPAWSLHQMEGEIGRAVGTTKLDLELELDERPDGHLAGRLIYDCDLFDAATAERIAEHWAQIVRAAAADPDRPAAALAALAPAEERRQVVEWNATATERSPSGLPDLVRERAAADPGAAAVTAAGRSVSYGELDARAAAVGRRLRAAGVVPGETVAVLAAPGADVAVGALGVLHAGAAFVLLDPELPRAHRDAVLADADVAALVGQADLLTDITDPPARVLAIGGADDGHESPPSHPGPAASDGLGCLHYGARTGETRGVRLAHAALVDAAATMAAELGLSPDDRVLALPQALYDLAIVELWAALVAGAEVVVAPAAAAADGAQLSKLIAAKRVSVFHAAPSTWEALLATGLRSARSLRAVSSGEPLGRALADAILRRCRVLWNAYSAAETTGPATMGLVDGDGPVTIGRPLANTRVHVLDANGRRAPVGVPGKLVIAGDGVAEGYRDRGEDTPEAFAPEPGGVGRAYRTGARARWLPDGRLELIGEA